MPGSRSAHPNVRLSFLSTMQLVDSFRSTSLKVKRPQPILPRLEITSNAMACQMRFIAINTAFFALISPIALVR